MCILKLRFSFRQIKKKLSVGTLLERNDNQCFIFRQIDSKKVNLDIKK